MVSEEELRGLHDELFDLVGFFYDHGNSEEQNDKMVSYACDIMDTIRWVVGDESTGHFLSGDFLDMAHLKSLVRRIEKRTQKKLSDYIAENRTPPTKEQQD